ncbi:MAG: hypothetical protein J1E39_00505 [Eubacterium sp.]|nr:hypothetical protein [Eubacterium sp.]
MTDIIVIETDTKLSEYIAREMSKNYFVRYLRGTKLTESGSGYMLDILSTESLTHICCQSAVVILGEGVEPEFNELSGKLTFIADSLDTKQLTALSRCNHPVITCGTFEKDTVSYTSITEDSVTVSLNRKVTALSGRSVQPLEFPVRMTHGYEIYHCLAVTALRILLDDFDSDLGKLY